MFVLWLIRANETSYSYHYRYLLNLRLIVWRVTRSLRPCDRLSIPVSVIFRQLIIRTNETSYSCHYSLLAEVESDGVQSSEMPETLR